MAIKWKTADGLYGCHDIAFLRILEKGTFSTVWFGVHVPSHRPLAVKIQNEDVMENRQAAKFMEDGEVMLVTFWDKANEELELLKRLQECPRVVRVLEVHLLEKERIRLLTLEFVHYESFVFDEKYELYEIPFGAVEGETEALRKSHFCLLNKQGFRVFAKELMLALNEIHKCKVVHKDVKPENIRLTRQWPQSCVRYVPMFELASAHAERVRFPKTVLQTIPESITHSISRDIEQEYLWDGGLDRDFKLGGFAVLNKDTASDEPLIKLIDFNVAVYTEHDEIWDAEGSQAFTPPEALIPQSANKKFSGSKRDMWSAGITLFASMFGHLPYWDIVPIKLQFDVISQPLRFPTYPSVDSDVQSILRQMLDKNPAQRLGPLECIHLLDRISEN